MWFWILLGQGWDCRADQVFSALFLTGALKHGMLGGAIQLTFRRMAFDYYPFHRAGREPVASQPLERDKKRV